ncbi:MAG TPA: HEAT repeat domain-containing protein [Vicinamibacterales bacterium]|nr:HEAT repeat domain-containing protein [Vicinamibacterales bacterium]
MPSSDGSPASGRLGILTTDASLLVTSWDAALAAMTGISREAAVGRALTDLIPDLESRHLLGVVREPLETGACRVLAPALHGFLICCPPPRGSRFAHMRQRVVIGPLRDTDRTVGLAITVEDVTERLEREQALAAELRHADTASRLRAIKALEQHDPVDGVGPLREALADDDWQVRRSAVRALAARRDRSIVEALVTALRDHHRNFSVLSSALQLLTTTGIDLTGALVDLLRHEDADLRIQAALALGTQEEQPAAIDALIAALDDPDVNVRFHAIEALGKLGSPSAVDRLASITESNDFFLAFPALDSLARIRDAAVAPRVVPLLRDALVGDHAAEVLGEIGDEDAVVPLVAALDRADSSVTSVVDALVAIAHRYRDTLGVQGHIDDIVRRTISPAGARRIIDAAGTTADASLKNLVVLLGWLRGPEVERALTHLLGASEVHQELIEAIVRFGSSMVDRLIAQLRGADLATRRAAAIALGHIGDCRAVPALVETLEGDDRDLLVTAAGALARLGDARAFEALIARLGDSDLRVRHAAIAALNSIGHPQMAACMRTLLDSPDAHVRESAVMIAGYFGYRDCAEGLLVRCHDADEAVRAAALEHIVYLDDERVLPLLVNALEHDTPRARAAVVQGLAHVTSPEVRPVLRRAAEDADPWVRYFSVTSLGRQADVGSLTILERAARDDLYPPVRIAAVEAIGAIGGDAAADLLATLTGSEVAEVSIGAIAALGQTASARAEEALRRALTSGSAAQRAAAASAIARWGHEPAVELLQWTAAADGDPAVVASAIAGLSRIGGGVSPAAASAIAALAALASDPARRGGAVAALAHLPVAAIPRVGACLSSRDPHVRHAVVEALGRLSHPVASAYVRSALEDSDATVRQHAVVVLARLGSRGVTRTFADLARRDPAEAVRRAADAALRRERLDEAAPGDAGATQ